jgi:PAS domain S-box-containing protein
MIQRGDLYGLRKDGSEFPAEASISKLELGDKMVFTVMLRDITEHRKSEEALRESRDQIRVITDNLPVLIAYIDSDQRYRFVNRTCTDWYARPAKEIIGKTIKDIHGSPYEKARPDIEAVLSGKARNLEKKIAYPDGVERNVRMLYLPHRGPGSQILGFFALVEDISDYKRTEEQLRQAQKMEAVGQLTGGLAHDFNNLLGIILGNLQLLEDSLEDGDERQDLVRPALRAVTRGGDLTHRLLAFSRRQPLKPEVTDLNALISGMVDLLTRTLGEAVTIETAPGSALWESTLDRAQMESALLNLAVNAKHAMPEGGTLTIETENLELDRRSARRFEVPPGPYVVAAVTDSGCGMPSEVMKQALEPFFTTRDVGQGSGLGLSMVYGFVKQSGGGIAIESKVGRGTTIRLCFPKAADKPAPAAKAKPASGVPMGAGETILVVEDNPDVREVATTLLSSLGYRILSAEDGSSALAVLEQSGEVELLFTDIVLPRGMNGVALAQQAVARHPALKVLYTSGYTDKADIGQNVLQDGVNLLRKPYAKAVLAQQIRQTLDGTGS